MSPENSHTVLCVDDEQNILSALKRLLRREGYRFFSAVSGGEAFDILNENEVHLIISDQRMPEMNGTEFLARVKDQYPDIIRIILTGYTDVDSITDSINKGHIYKFFLKPWNDNNLKLEIRQALNQYDLIQANRQLDKTVVEQNRQLKKINENLEEMVEERTREIAFQNQALALSHAILDDLPLAIIGVDHQAMVVLANKAALNLSCRQHLQIGEPVGESLSLDIEAAVKEVAVSGEYRKVKISDSLGCSYSANLSPFAGPYQSKGVIITITEQ